MNIYFTEVFRLVHHFTCIYTSSWISHTSDSHKSFNIDIYISFVLPAVCASFIQGLYFWFRVLKVIIPVYQYITTFFLRFSTPATGTLRSWSARHQFDACASRWCPTDANPSAPMVRAVSTFSFVLKEEMKTSVMAWCRQATSHYLSQWWPRSLSPYGITRPQWVNSRSLCICHRTVSSAHPMLTYLRVESVWPIKDGSKRNPRWQHSRDSLPNVSKGSKRVGSLETIRYSLSVMLTHWPWEIRTNF